MYGDGNAAYCYCDLPHNRYQGETKLGSAYAAEEENGSNAPYTNL
jgi:hypothetical protein